MNPEELFGKLASSQEEALEALEIIQEQEEMVPYTLTNFWYCVTKGLLTDEDGVVREVETPNDGRQDFNCNIESFKDAYNSLKELEENGKEVMIYWYAK